MHLRWRRDRGRRDLAQSMTDDAALELARDVDWRADRQVTPGR
jgi:hypothetical protein